MEISWRCERQMLTVPIDVGECQPVVLVAAHLQSFRHGSHQARSRLRAQAGEEPGIALKPQRRRWEKLTPPLPKETCHRFQIDTHLFLSFSAPIFAIIRSIPADH
jgi:hypothetical protein